MRKIMILLFVFPGLLMAACSGLNLPVEEEGSDSPSEIPEPTATPLDETPPEILYFSLRSHSYTRDQLVFFDLFAEDDVAIEEYLITTVNENPQLDDPSWSSDIPDSLLLPNSSGTFQLYLWVKDTSGNLNSAVIDKSVTLFRFTQQPGDCWFEPTILLGSKGDRAMVDVYINNFDENIVYYNIQIYYNKTYMSLPDLVDSIITTEGSSKANVALFHDLGFVSVSGEISPNQNRPQLTHLFDIEIQFNGNSAFKDELKFGNIFLRDVDYQLLPTPRGYPMSIKVTG